VSSACKRRGGRLRLTKPCRFKTACTVLMAGKLLSLQPRRSFSRILGAPELHARLNCTINTSIWKGKRLA
jgi:hypothetical protein